MNHSYEPSAYPLPVRIPCLWESAHAAYPAFASGEDPAARPGELGTRCAKCGAVSPGELPLRRSHHQGSWVMDASWWIHGGFMGG